MVVILYNDYKYYKSYIPSPEETGNPGGYKVLAVYIQAEIIYDFTVEFTAKYIPFKSRTKDQMDQAGRSGKQNIAEGYLQKSFEGRIKLLGVARGSLEELLNDYQDYLRQRNLLLWPMDSAKAQDIRSLVYKNYKIYNGYKIYKPDYKDYQDYLSSPESAANAMICLMKLPDLMVGVSSPLASSGAKSLRSESSSLLPTGLRPGFSRRGINQTNQLLDQKIRWTEEKFIKEGGFRENLLKKRLEYRKKNNI